MLQSHNESSAGTLGKHFPLPQIRIPHYWHTVSTTWAAPTWMGSIADLAQKIKLNAGVSNPRLAQIAASAAHTGRFNHYTRESSHLPWMVTSTWCLGALSLQLSQSMSMCSDRRGMWTSIRVQVRFCYMAREDILCICYWLQVPGNIRSVNVGICTV